MEVIIKEIDWFGSLPAQDRGELIKQRQKISAEERAEIKRYDEKYFDGATPFSYGGYHYDGRFQGVVERMIEHYGLGPGSNIIDIGCAKGYLTYEFFKQGIFGAYGIDVSSYAIANCPEEIKDKCFVGSADDLSRWPDDFFDLVLSKDVIHNLDPDGADRALREIVRTYKGQGFLQINSYVTPHQLECLKTWVVTIETIRSNDEWIEAFEKSGYDGDYFFLNHDYALE